MKLGIVYHISMLVPTEPILNLFISSYENIIEIRLQWLNVLH
jgi:hypothetical protein